MTCSGTRKSSDAHRPSELLRVPLQGAVWVSVEYTGSGIVAEFISFLRQQIARSCVCGIESERTSAFAARDHLGSRSGARGRAGVRAPRGLLLGSRPPLAVRHDGQDANGRGRGPGDILEGLGFAAAPARCGLIPRVVVPNRATLLGGCTATLQDDT